jgi:probable rRNA maturation factor
LHGPRCWHATAIECSLVLADDPIVRELNAAYRGRDRETDVLSFSQQEGVGAGVNTEVLLLGDVVISVEQARRQAGRGASALEEEIVRLFVHGLCHLLGHDHDVRTRAEAMRAEERRLMEEVDS